VGEAVTKLERYIEVAEEILRLGVALAEQANAHFTGSERQQTLADRVLIGLALKIHSTLRALLVDALANRAEAMHHLKTMVEAFIYYRIVAADPSGEKATLVLAKTINEKRRFFEANPDYVPEAEIRQWQSTRDELLRQVQRGRGQPEDSGCRDLLREIDNLADLSCRAGLGAWYARAYRLANESAHIGDLLEFMPKADERIVAAPPDTAPYHALVALDLGLHIGVDLMRTISEMNSPAIRVDTAPLQKKLEDIRAS
jgi:hypothetical protein